MLGPASAVAIAYAVFATAAVDAGVFAVTAAAFVAAAIFVSAAVAADPFS